MSEAVLAAAKAAFDGGDFLRAVELATEITRATPPALEAHVLRANAAVKLERWTDAIASLQILRTHLPQQASFTRLLATCWLRLGNRQRAAGEVAAAQESYGAALQADPQSQDARYNLGLLYLDNNEPAQAEHLLRAVSAALPDDTEARLDWARALVACEREAEAAPLLRELAMRDVPRLAQAALGALVEAGFADEATRMQGNACRSGAARVDAALELAGEMRQHGQLDDAVALLDTLAPLADAAMQLRIDLARLLALPAVYRDAAHLDAARARYAAGLETLIERWPATRVAALRSDADTLVHDNFLLAYQCRDDRALQQRYGAWLDAATEAALPPLPPLARQRRSKPRVAIVSSFLRECTVGAYFFAWTAQLVRAGFEVVAVQIGKRHDARTQAFGAAAHRLLLLDGNLAAMATALRELEADVALFPEIGMDGRTLALAARRVAPLQVCAWGHPVTTGLSAMDAFYTCTDMEPAGASAHYSERLLLLPGLGTRYASPEVPPPAAREELGLPVDRSLYLVPQSAFKIHPDNDAVFADIVRRDRDACFVLFGGEKRGVRRLLHERLHTALGAVSATPERHLRFLPMTSRSHYLRINQACDVMLDNLHWSGGNTALDALHCGLPVVACPGEFMRGRQSQAMLRTLDCADLIAATPRGLAATAVDIAHDPARRAALGRRIARNLPALVDDAAPLQALGERLHDLLGEAHDLR